jgi:hypothetical protein
MMAHQEDTEHEGEQPKPQGKVARVRTRQAKPSSADCRVHRGWARSREFPLIPGLQPLLYKPCREEEGKGKTWIKFEMTQFTWSSK